MENIQPNICNIYNVTFACIVYKHYLHICSAKILTGKTLAIRPYLVTFFFVECALIVKKIGGFLRKVLEKEMKIL